MTADDGDADKDDGMPKGFYEGYIEEIHEVYIYMISSKEVALCFSRKEQRRKPMTKLQKSL